MRKLLLLLGTFGVIAAPISSVISCSPKEALSEEDVYNKMVEIASEPIEYNDSFLINYDSPNATRAILHEMFSIMDDYALTSTNLINQLLTKIVYERVLKTIPNIKKFYPSFTLRTESNWDSKDIDEQFDNLVNNHKFTMDYLIFYNLHSLDEIKSFRGGSSGGERSSDNSNLSRFSEISTPHYYQYGEYLIWNVIGQTFSFMQSKFIVDTQERLDFYMNLYQNTTGAVKPFSSDSANNSLNMFGIVNINYKKNNLPQNAIEEIKNNTPIEAARCLKIIEGYIRNPWFQYNHLDQLYFSELGLIDGFETNLTFDSAYTATEIKNNQKLNYVFGVHDGSDGNPPGFYNGALIFDLNIKVKFQNQTSQEKLNEKLYIRVLNN